MILIVDDNENNIYSLKKLLESKGFKVHAANSGERALANALQNDYFLIILDVQMPGMDGFEVAETLAAYSKTKEIPIIFLSAVNTDKRFITKGYKSGGIDYVTKPIDPEILILKVKTFYDLQQNKLAMKMSQKSLELEVEERKVAQVFMRSEIDHFHLMLEALPQIAFTLNQDGVVNFVNRKWFEYSFSDQEFPDTHPEDLNIQEGLLQFTMTRKTFQLEVRIKNKDSGDYRYHLLRMSPVFQDEKIKNWVGTFTDIDEQKKVEKEKDEFLSIASHELKTPLTSIKAYIQLLERKMKSNKEGANVVFVEKALDQIERLNILIINLLDVSRIEDGKLKINKELSDVEQLISSTVETILQTSNNRNIKIECHFESNKQLISLDVIRIEQVLINFLTNAIKYSPKNNHIIVTTSTSKNELKVSITDFGIGIPAFKQNEVFRKFYRVEESSVQFQGMGIGLYICSEIIKEHNGTIGVLSKVNEGSTFYFTLPLN